MMNIYLRFTDLDGSTEIRAVSTLTHLPAKGELVYYGGLGADIGKGDRTGHWIVKHRVWGVSAHGDSEVRLELERWTAQTTS